MKKVKKTIIWLLILQVSLTTLVQAEEVAFKEPISAALKSVALPGWGQYENGENDKGKNILMTTGLYLFLYALTDQQVKQAELGSFPQETKDLYVFQRKISAAGLAATYLASIADAYFSAVNFNFKNQFEEKDPKTALLWSALFPGLGSIYVGDNIFDGVSTTLTSAYFLNLALAGNATEKSWGTGGFGFMYVISLFSYRAAEIHNERIKQLMQERKIALRPVFDPLSKRFALSWAYLF